MKTKRKRDRTDTKLIDLGLDMDTDIMTIKRVPL